MGLTERRAIKAFQENKYPKLKAEMDTAAGFDVPVVVDWDTIIKKVGSKTPPFTAALCYP